MGTATLFRIRGERLKDETKKKKYFLKRYRNYLTRINRLEEQLASVNERLVGLQSKVMTDMPGGGLPITKDDLLEKKEELQHRIDTLTNTSKKVRREILDCIDILDDFRFAEILEAYFIELKTLEEIAEEKHYSIRHCGFLYAKALETINVNE